MSLLSFVLDHLRTPHAEFRVTLEREVDFDARQQTRSFDLDGIARKDTIGRLER